MKYTFTTLICAFFLASSGISLAQTTSKAPATDDQAKNLLKINVPAIFLNNYSFQYERAIGRKISAGLGLRFMPKSGLPLKSQIKSIIDDDDTWDKLNNIKTSNFALTPEVRFYMGQGVFRGFYVAPFAKYAKYKADLSSFNFDVTVSDNTGTMYTQTESIPLSGELKTITGGVLIGAQWKLSRLLYLDWWILGPQYGGSKGHLAGTKSLSQDEQDALKSELEDLDIPIVDTETHVDSKGARMDIKGPWTGLRAGINLGVRF